VSVLGGEKESVPNGRVVLFLDSKGKKRGKGEEKKRKGKENRKRKEKKKRISIFRFLLDVFPPHTSGMIASFG
jgi:hypothetical protein